jgi:hypothetical protein
MVVRMKFSKNSITAGLHHDADASWRQLLEHAIKFAQFVVSAANRDIAMPELLRCRASHES